MPIQSTPTGKRKRKERDFFASWPSEADACMDYLHGRVEGNEIEAACFYEYARESSLLREAAKLRKQGFPRASKDRRKHFDNVALKLAEKYSLALLNGPLWRSIWCCRSFPSKPWKQLKESERRKITAHFPATKAPPLSVATIGELRELFNAEPPDSEPALVHEQGRTYALVALDCAEPKKQQLKRYKAWLELPENREKFTQHRRNAVGTTGTFKDRLKDLAVVRLFEQLGFDEMLAFTETNRLRDKHGRRLAFHDARRGQSGKGPLNEAPLCSEESFCRKAAASLTEFLKQHFPTAAIPSRFSYVEAVAKVLPKGP